MKLTYRGISYTLNFSPVDRIEDGPNASSTIGKYRGAPLYIHQHQRPAKPQASIKLQYRGAPYQPALRPAISPDVKMA